MSRAQLPPDPFASLFVLIFGGFGLICVVFSFASLAFPYWPVPLVIGLTMLGTALTILATEYLDN